MNFSAAVAILQSLLKHFVAERKVRDNGHPV